jgi:hypothetical protein
LIEICQLITRNHSEAGDLRPPTQGVWYDNHEDALRDDKTGVYPGAQHPSPMLIDLQAFDIVDS